MGARVEILLAIVIVTTNAQPTGKKCCESKTVGGISYTLVGEMDTKEYNCLNDCVYQKKEEPGTKYCFAVGDEKVECKDGPPMGGSKPPMEGTKPPMEGSKPPMEGSKPPMEGSKPPMAGSSKPETGTTGAPGGCKCGVKKTSRIVGGSETEVNEYPWMAKFDSFFCGGALIASQWILTAAHCLENEDGSDLAAAAITMVLGEHDLQSESESLIPRKDVSVTTVIKHPDYGQKQNSLINDIALLKLSEEVDLNVYTPACLPSASDNFEGKKAWVYGWGTTSSGGNVSPKLLEVEVPVVTNSVCNTAMEPNGFPIDNSMVCAGGEAGKDGCQGDSGGPLTVDVSGQHYLIGDTSFGDGCAEAGKYGVYGDVAFFRSWIDTTITNNGGAKYCPAA